MKTEIGPLHFDGEYWVNRRGKLVMCLDGLKYHYPTLQNHETIWLCISTEEVEGAIKARRGDQHVTVGRGRKGHRIFWEMQKVVPGGDYWCWVEREETA